MRHSSDKSYYVNLPSDIITGMHNNFESSFYFLFGFTGNYYEAVADYKKGRRAEAATGPVPLHILSQKCIPLSNYSLTSRKGTTNFGLTNNQESGIFFIKQNKKAQTHRCADIPGALIAQGSWGNRQNGIVSNSFLLMLLL